MEMRLSHYSIVTLDNLSDIPYGSSLNDDIIHYFWTENSLLINKMMSRMDSFTRSSENEIVLARGSLDSM
jgi:hypothetical protein